jgi:hypothetical protein
MEHRGLQLILPFEPALPDRLLILAPRFVADDDAKSAATVGEAGGASAPVRTDRG